MKLQEAARSSGSPRVKQQCLLCRASGTSDSLKERYLSTRIVTGGISAQRHSSKRACEVARGRTKQRYQVRNTPTVGFHIASNTGEKLDVYSVASLQNQTIYNMKIANVFQSEIGT